MNDVIPIPHFVPPLVLPLSLPPCLRATPPRLFPLPSSHLLPHSLTFSLTPICGGREDRGENGEDRRTAYRPSTLLVFDTDINIIQSYRLLSALRTPGDER